MARENQNTSTNVAKVTAVIQPTTPGYGYLPHTKTELQKIEEKIPKEWLTSLNTSETPTSLEAILSHLRESSIVHFACHGVQDTLNPLESCLLIGGAHLKVSQLMETSGASHDTPSTSTNVQSPGLAFLSACETATGDTKLPDESMHLAATLLFARFSSVIATMW
jgi:CHAT domain-containing protein